MPTGGRQTNETVRQWAIFEDVYSQVAQHVVHPVQGFFQSQRQTFGRRNADRERTHKARTSGNCDGVHVVQSQPALVQRGPHGGQETFQVRPRRYFGDYPPETRVFRHRCRGDIHQQVIPAG